MTTLKIENCHEYTTLVTEETNDILIVFKTLALT